MHANTQLCTYGHTMSYEKHIIHARLSLLIAIFAPTLYVLAVQRASKNTYPKGFKKSRKQGMQGFSTNRVTVQGPQVWPEVQ